MVVARIRRTGWDDLVPWVGSSATAPILCSKPARGLHELAPNEPMATPMAAHAAKPPLPDARVRQEAQQTLSAWAEKNHHGRSWRTGCRTRWFVMHGFHVRYYADEKAARQAATIRTTSA